jgi:hypothetical protein
MNSQGEVTVDSVHFCKKVQIDSDASARVSEPVFASGAYPVEGNSSIDLQDILVQNLVLVRHSYMLKNLYRPYLFVAYFEALLSVHVSQKEALEKSYQVEKVS